MWEGLKLSHWQLPVGHHHLQPVLGTVSSTHVESSEFSRLFEKLFKETALERTLAGLVP